MHSIRRLFCIVIAKPRRSNPADEERQLTYSISLAGASLWGEAEA